MNRHDHLRPIDNRLLIGSGKVVLSMKLGDFVDWKLFLRSPAIKTAFFMAEKMFPISAAKKRGVFLAGKWQTKKRHPRKDVSVSGVEQGVAV